jgi:hypothetical protein
VQQHLDPCPSTCLQEVCEAKLGQSRDRLREYSFEEVQAANAAGNCWLILSGASMRSLACAICPTPKGLYRQQWRVSRQVHCSTVLGRRGLLCHAGMILDVTRWLPEHPGGSTIIPAQALNIECSRFFEVGRESGEMQVEMPLQFSCWAANSGS